MKGGGTRGQVSGMSSASKLRALECIGLIDRSKVRATWFLTLTATPKVLSWENVEQVRRAYIERLKRSWGHLRWCLFWKKENHKSGRPHLHAIIFWLDQPPGMLNFRKWNDLAWSSVVCKGDVGEREKVRRCGCRAERVNSWNGVAWYAAKYIAEAKNDQGQTMKGRPWGVERRDVYHSLCEVTQSVVTPAVGRRFRRNCRRLVARRRDRWFLVVDGKSSVIRPAPIKLLSTMLGRADLDGISATTNVLLQVEHYQSMISRGSGFSVGKIKLKRRRAKTTWCKSVTQWHQDESSGRMEKGGEERHSFASSLYFINAAEADLLMRNAIALAEDLPQVPNDGIPF